MEAAEQWTAELESELAQAKTSQEVISIQNMRRPHYHRLMDNPHYEKLFFRAYYAFNERYHVLLGQEWGPPFNRPDAHFGGFWHPSDPRKPKR